VWKFFKLFFNKIKPSSNLIYICDLSQIILKLRLEIKMQIV
jgi:hypothetical protein